MALLITQFEKACSNVEPDEDDVTHAIEAHEDVRATLEAAEELAGLDVDTILIGSYRRHVSIRRVKDVDVFSRTSGLNMTGSEALDLLFRVLADTYGEDRVHRQDRSIKVDFPDFDLYVDAVPARPAGDYWEIPDSDDGWVETNPEELTALSSAMNDRYHERYVPVVKLIRQTRRTHLGKRPGGFFFEILTYHAFDGFPADLEDGNLAELYVQALAGVADQLEEVVVGGEVSDPTMDEAVIKVRVTDTQMSTAATKFRELATRGADALKDEEICSAAKVFRDLLGKTSDGDWVFEMPASCNDDGTKRAVAVVAGDRKVPAGDRRFA